MLEINLTILRGISERFLRKCYVSIVTARIRDIFCIRLFPRGFIENKMFLLAKTMHISCHRDNMWLADPLATNSRGGGSY